MFLLQSKNLLLGGMPESVGLLIFGVGLVAVTILLRWLFNENDTGEVAEESLEKFPAKINH